jgi:thiamine-monophosphate kinase
MKIKDIGGEFGLIERIKSKVKLFSNEVIVGIGDDAAVLKFNKGNYQLLTTDILIENEHFSLKFYSSQQVGMKAIEQNVSDIAAMGGIPKFALVSLAVPKKIDIKVIDGIYEGINKKCKEYKIDIAGGNVSRSKSIIINISLVGIVKKSCLTLRKGAKVNDLIFCSGYVGKSAAGLELLIKDMKGKSIKNHLEPKARLNLSKKLVKIGINSMIDVSDGVASEIRHICKNSNVGAEIYLSKLPISKNTIKDAKKIKKNPVDLALYGGEDFELIFTASKNKLMRLKKLDVNIIGKIIEKKKGLSIFRNKKLIEVQSGFDHFKKQRTRS